jgi:putative endonuclease
MSSPAVPAKAGTHIAACIMFFAYLLASKPHGTLYTGSTSDLVRRVWEHKVKAVPGFTAKYGVDRLVWFEGHETLEAAMQRERRIKSWKRAWKIELIEEKNPHWIDLFASISR